ncbi:hypothetical protein DEU56DRAFT_773432 [Suillus clintonianus]|uniref:uncharacterized protein n=1 Tax=Suillus clintonianus TaxID=1904413 RepID=UPI001B8795DC|nr:uncharacterized protein DEU56DRAFT_773432 [Suillus clintonianus]KAG2153163.1 hypothetical protein DEU56DRAFT_773432 [Suillus clintonianus]
MLQTISQLPLIRNLVTGSFTQSAAASKPEPRHARDHTRWSPDDRDMAGRKRASNEQERSAPRLRTKYPTPEETEARAKDTIPEMNESGPSGQTNTKPYYPLSPTTARAGKQEVDAGSCRPSGSPVIHSPRISDTPPGTQGGEENTSTRRPRSYATAHESHQQLPLPAPSVTRSRSSNVLVRSDQSLESEIEQLNKQFASIREKLDRCRKENERLAGERKNAEAVTWDMQTALRTADADVIRLRNELSKSNSENNKLRQEMEHFKRHADIARSLGARLRETETTLASKGHALDAATNQLKAMSEQKAQLHTLLDDRTSELKGAQSFLTTADASSGADVISMLQRLNAEVLQSAAYMAESMVDAFSFETGGVRDESACAAVTKLFGQPLAHYLSTKKHKDDPLLIQITFQSCFVEFLEFVICSWTLPGGDANRMFAGTYERIKHGEAQAISGRWRALTSAYTHSHEESRLVAMATSHLAERFSNIMLAAGCSLAPDILRASVEKKLSDRIVLLFKLAMQLNKIVMEEITSADLKPVIVPIGITYSAERMEDAYVDGYPATGGVRVLCTTDLGLGRMTRLATSGDKQWDSKLLLKPKVALETVVNSMGG